MPADTADPGGQVRNQCRSLSSSQLLQALLFTGDIVPRQAGLYTHMMGLESALRDPHPPSPNIEQFKTFLCAVVMAARLSCTLGVAT